MAGQYFSIPLAVGEYGTRAPAGPVPVSCEFCDEFRDFRTSRFGQLYPALTSRIVAEMGEFVAVPTIGPLAPCSMLVLPRQHVECAAMLRPSQLDRLEEAIAEVKSRLVGLGKCVIFEHGAASCTGGSCGIYHAHIHVVPLNQDVTAADFLGRGFEFLPDLRSALRALKNAPAYLLFRDTAGAVAFRRLVPGDACKYPSQFMRRRLAEFLGLDRPWNWREYDHQEPWVWDALAHFKPLDRS